MNALLTEVKKSSTLARVVPFVVFLILTYLGGEYSSGTRYWIYLGKALLCGWILWEIREAIPEMRWAVSWEAVVVGVGVFIMWVGLDPFYPGLQALSFKFGFSKEAELDPAKYWNPFVMFGEGTVMAWTFVVIRFASATIVVPALEEVFYRSFLYRYLISPEFERVSLRQRHVVSLGITCLIFAFTHEQWLAGILCGVAYQWLVWRKGRIGDAMTAHSITNFLLGLWVVTRGDWKFW